MQILCPQCKTRFNFDENRIVEQGVKLRCSKCKTVFRVMRKGGECSVVSEAVAAGNVIRPKLIVANESAAFCSAVQKVLEGEMVEVIAFNDGLEAMRAIEALKPAVVLLDVALPSMYGFEICEAVRQNKALDSVKLILVASIYDKTKYKRTPSSLYGADAYIEKHHIPDSLAVLVKKLVTGVRDEGDRSPVPPSGSIAATVGKDARNITSEEKTRDELKRDEELTTTVSTVSSQHIAPADLSEFTVKARRLARIIVSDILLYNQDKVMEGIKSGTFFELLKDEIREGKSLYARRVPAEVKDGSRYLDDAFDQLISSKRRELGL